MSKATRIAKRRIRKPPKHILVIAADVGVVATQTGDRAYQFVRLDDDSLLEVRVWPDGAAKLTPVDHRGRPHAAPLKLKF